MSEQNLSVLVIDDEVQIQRFLKITLEANHYKVFQAATGAGGLLEATMRRPELILLDLGLPDMEGVAVLRSLREWSQVPVLILSVKDRDNEKISALDAGADDYLTKPFSTGELLARLRVAQRHLSARQNQAEPIFTAGPLQVDLSKRHVTLNGEDIRLTKTEYQLLQLFISHAGKVLTHSFILREIWGKDFVAESHYLRVYMAQLRRKLEMVPAQPRLFITEPGVGYRLDTIRWGDS